MALITGEEKIKPAGRRAITSAPSKPCRATCDVEFVAVDEIQLAADPDRGHVFTDGCCTPAAWWRRCSSAPQTIADTDPRLMPGANIIGRPRLSQLSYAGPKKLTAAAAALGHGRVLRR